MFPYIQNHVFDDGVDEHGNLIVMIGPDHPLAKMNAVDRSRLISGAIALLEAMRAMTTQLRYLAATLDVTIAKGESGDWE